MAIELKILSAIYLRIPSVIPLDISHTIPLENKQFSIWIVESIFKQIYCGRNSQKNCNFQKNSENGIAKTVSKVIATGLSQKQIRRNSWKNFSIELPREFPQIPNFDKNFQINRRDENAKCWWPSQANSVGILKKKKSQKNCSRN